MSSEYDEPELDAAGSDDGPTYPDDEPDPDERPYRDELPPSAYDETTGTGLAGVELDLNLDPVLEQSLIDVSEDFTDL